jgi:hypothetical protein
MFLRWVGNTLFFFLRREFNCVFVAGLELSRGVQCVVVVSLAGGFNFNQ